MNKSSLTRVQILLVVVLAVLVFVRLLTGPPAPEGLVVFVDLEAGDLRHAAFEVQQPAVFAVEATGSFDPAAVPAALAAEAWILRRDDRSVVWQIDAARAEPGRGHLARVPADTFVLDPGVYDVYFAAAGAVYGEHRGRWRKEADDWRFVLRATDEGARVRALPDVRDERLGPGGEDLIWTSAPQRDDREEAYLFEATRPTRLRLYAVGEIDEEMQDYGWIENATTGERVWEMSKTNTEAAGGLPRNRAFRGEVALEPGTYRAVSVTDRRHAYDDWEGNPPFDPAAWGLSLFAEEPGALSPFDPWRSRKPLIQFIRIPDDAERHQRFEVTQPIQVVAYGMGEITRDGSYDFAELLKEDGSHQETIWRMSREHSVPAGGGEKNRLEIAFLRLDPGVYVLRYETDGSHAYDDWNTARPDHAERWGVTLFPMVESLDDGVFRLLSEAAPYSTTMTPNLKHAGEPLVQWTRLGNDTSLSQTFELDAETPLHVVGLGEITRSGQHDFGSIENAETGETVWAMTLDNTSAAGGTARNRRFDGVVTLPPGRYTARYRTDFSHAFDDFGHEAPSDAEAWGMTVYRLGGEPAGGQ